MDGQPTTPQASASTSSGKLKKILIIVGIVVASLAALGAGIFFLVYSLTKGPADAAEQFLRDIANEQIEKAYNDTAGVFKQYTSLSQFEAAIAQNSVLSQLRDISLPNRSIENSDATVSGTITSESGETAEVAVSLQKENGKWKVVGMEAGGGTGPVESQASGGVGEDQAGQDGGQTPSVAAGNLPQPPKEGQGIFVQAFENAAAGTRFDIYDSTGTKKLDSYQPVNTFIDLPVGTYALVSYNDNLIRYPSPTTVQSGKITVITLGAIIVETPAGVSNRSRFDIYDATGKTKLSSYQAANGIIILPLGTYSVRSYDNNMELAKNVVVNAGQLTKAVILGAVQYNGTSRYDLYDETGTNKLDSYLPPKEPIALPAGSYVLKKYGTELELGKIAITSGQVTSVQ